MTLSFFTKGLILGFLVAAPVGPIGILCIRRTLQFGRLSGFFSGLGAAVADTFYGVIAAFGLTFISHLLTAGQFWLRLIGGAFLIYLGLRTFFAHPVARTDVPHKTLIADFVSTFLLTMTNPMTILAYVAVFAGLGLSHTGELYYVHAVWLVLGVFIGSAIWWLILSEGVTLFRKKVSQKVMRGINRIAGLLIGGFGIAVWITLFFGLGIF